MSIVDLLSPDLSESVQSCLGDRFDHGVVKVVRMEAKADKLEHKVLALSKYRAFILSFKVPTKVESEFNFLEIHSMESYKPLQLKIHVTIKKDSLPKTVYTLLTNTTQDVDSIIETIALEIRKCFPNVNPLERVIPRITVKPESRLTDLNMKLEETFPDSGPCGGFTQMYSCMCDLHQEPFMPEVAWDVDTIYLSHDSRELCLNDFDHLSNRDLVPIISALIYNSWFTNLSFRNASKLNSDALREINKMLQKSSHLEQLVLENVGLKGSFMEDMCIAVMSNQNTVLRSLNLSNNSLDDRGIRHLSGLLTRLPSGLVEINLAKTGLTAEGTLHFGRALSQNNFMSTTLVKLNVAGNQFKDGDISNLTGFLAQPNSLTHLILADTECALDNVFVALFRGCSANLSHLNLAGNTFTHRKGKSVPIQVSFKQFFATCASLKYLNLSRNKLPPEVVKEVLRGIGANNNLQDVELDLSSNELKKEGGQEVASCIAHISNVATLNLSDNDLNNELCPLVDWIGHSLDINQKCCIQSLDISKNMGGLKSRQLLKVLETIVQVIQNEELSLQSLSLADNKMKFETIQIINALGSNTTLTSIDISGNGMGDIGARMLAKALQLNTKLHTVKLDGNGITHVGFNDLVNALEKNYTLKYMPTPVNDISAALRANPERTSSALQKIQTLLQRNHSEHKFQDRQAFRLQQGFLYTTSHQMVDKLVVQIQDFIRCLIDCQEEEVQAEINRALVTIPDADNSKLLLAALHEVALRSDEQARTSVEKSNGPETGDNLPERLTAMASKLSQIVEAQLKTSASGMIDTAAELCSSVMEDSALRQGLTAMCLEQTKLPPRFLQDVVEQVGAAISNRMGEAHLAMASHISDTIIEELMEELKECHQKLSEQLSAYRARRGSVMPNGTETETKEEEGDKEAERANESTAEAHGEGAPKSPDSAECPSRQFVAGQRMSRYQRREMARSNSVRFKDSEIGQQRKSIKVRPQSVIIKDYQMTAIDIEEVDSSERVDGDAVDGAALSKPATPAPAPTLSPAAQPTSPPKRTKKKASAADVKALDQVTTSAEVLSDVRKDRPRPPRKRPLRPVVAAGTAVPGSKVNATAAPLDEGISAFFSTDLVQPRAETPTAAKPAMNSNASPDLNKAKKKNRLFHKKEKTEENPKKKEQVKSKKLGGLKGIFKRKQSMPEELHHEQPPKSDARKASLPTHGTHIPEQVHTAKEEDIEEERPKPVERKAMLPSVHQKLFKLPTSPPKEPEPKEAEKPTVADKAEAKNEDEKAAAAEDDEREPIEETKEDKASKGDKPERPQENQEAKEDEPKQEDVETDKDEEAAEQGKKESEKNQEKLDEPGGQGEKTEEDKEAEKEEAEKEEEAQKEKEKAEKEKEEAEKQKEKEVEKEAPKKEESCKKPGLAGAQMLGGQGMLQEMKLRRERKAADRASREILESQAPKVEESQAGDAGKVAPASPDKSLPKFKLPHGPIVSSPPTSPPVRPATSPRLRASLEGPRKSPLEKEPPAAVIAPCSPPPATADGKLLLPKTDREEDAPQPKPTEALDKPKPSVKPRPLSGKFEAKSPTSPEPASKPFPGLKRLSSATPAEEPAAAANGTDVPPKPASRLSLEVEDRQADSSPLPGKPNGTAASPKPRPKPSRRLVSPVPAKKPEVSELRKSGSPIPPKPEEKQVTLEKTPLKSNSLNRDTAAKPPPMVASKPRSRSLDPAKSVDTEPRPVVARADALLEVPGGGGGGKRDSVLSRTSDDGTIEDPDQYSAI